MCSNITSFSVKLPATYPQTNITQIKDTVASAYAPCNPTLIMIFLNMASQSLL
jgi:hypothetical protein